MLELFSELNWLAVLVAALAWYVLAAIYFARPLLGRAWERAAGVSLPADYRPPPATFVITFVAYFVAAIAIGLLVYALNITQVGDAIELGAILAVGIIGVHAITSAMYEQRSKNLLWLYGGNALIGFSTMAVILALWD
jgi:hypothetical protein